MHRGGHRVWTASFGMARFTAGLAMARTCGPIAVARVWLSCVWAEGRISDPDFLRCDALQCE